MQWTHEHDEQIQHLLPKQRGNVEIDNETFFEAMIHLTENGFRWRAMPEKYGKWNTLYRRFRRWTASGVFDRIEKHLQSQAVSNKKITVLALDSTYIKVHPDGAGASQKG
ncbi:MAG: transposase [Planctomycetaceae bacterium]|jgi:transposase|nr:transposase [Planctomycetaceae bacterium]